MTEEHLIDAVFDAEGRRYADQSTHPPIDQPTAPGGITLPTLSAYLGRTATLAELRALSPATARPVVRWKLRQLALGAKLDRIAFEPLRMQMIDFAYNSGEGLAIRWLQRVLRVPRTGTMDGVTIAAVQHYDPWLVNQALVAARLEMVDRWTDSSAQAKAWEEGVESRGLRYSLLEVP